jgi:hypothetical protein
MNGSPDRDGKREIVQAAAGLLLERDRFGLMRVSAAALLTISDFDAERLRLRIGFASVPVEAGDFDAVAGPALALILRPRPSSLAMLERCSE